MTNIEILAGSEKIKKIEDILENLDLIFDMLKEDVIKIIKATGGFCDESFEEKYAQATRWTKKQLDKHHLRIFKRIYTCNSVKQALKLLLTRIVANTRNQFDNKRKNTVAYCSAKVKETLKQNVVEKMQLDPLELLLDKEMQILSDQEKIENLKEYKKELLKIAEIKKNENNNLQLVISF